MGTVTQRKWTYWHRRRILHWVLLALSDKLSWGLQHTGLQQEKGAEADVTSPSLLGTQRIQGARKPSFVHRFTNIQKINNILRQYKCKYCSLVSITYGMPTYREWYFFFIHRQDIWQCTIQNALIILIFVSGAEISWKELHLQLIKYFQEQTVHFVQDL